MLPEERRRALLQDIAKLGTATIPDLSEKYQVSGMTIRRDLKLLEQEGLVTLTHGGVIYDGEQAGAGEIFYPDRAEKNLAQKQAIGKYIADHFISDNDVLILDPGTTVASMIPYLKNKDNLTLISNGLLTMNALHRHLPSATIHCTGGILREGSMTFIGAVAERYFDDTFADTVVISGAGFTIENGVTDPQQLDTEVKRAMIRSTTSCIVAIDSSKFGTTAMKQVLKTNAIQTLVTDTGAPQSFVAQLQAMNIDIHLVDY